MSVSRLTVSSAIKRQHAQFPFAPLCDLLRSEREPERTLSSAMMEHEHCPEPFA